MWQSSWISLWKLRCAWKLSRFCVKISVFWNVATSIKIHCVILLLFRSSHQRCSLKIGVLKNFAKFAGKHSCQSLFFNKVVGFLFKKRLWRTSFLQVTASDFLQYDQVFLIPCFYGSSQWLFKVKITSKLASFIKSKIKVGYVCLF